MTLNSAITHDINRSRIMRQNAFISLFAMALIYIAPLISQLNHATMDHSAMNHSGMAHSDMAHSDMAHSDMDHSAMAHEALQAGEMLAAVSHQDHSSTTTYSPTHSNQEAANHFGLEAACGYCTLLFHLNWLNVHTFSLPAMPQSPYTAINASILEADLPTVYASVQPRAPPFLSRHS